MYIFSDHFFFFFRYGNSREWNQRSGHQDYDNLISKGYPEHLKDSEVSYFVLWEILYCYW